MVDYEVFSQENSDIFKFVLPHSRFDARILMYFVGKFRRNFSDKICDNLILITIRPLEREMAGKIAEK